jgi:alpha-galactosidase
MNFIEPMSCKQPVRWAWMLTIFAVLSWLLTGQAVCAGEIPKILPASDGKQADHAKPVKVYVMFGQSNMLGFGRVEPKELKGTLEYFVHTKDMYPHLVDRAGNWIARQDVRYVHVMDQRGVDFKDLEKFGVVRNEWLVQNLASGK